MANPHNLQIGQPLWFVTAWKNHGYETKINKVGNKWAHLDNGHRIDLEEMIADGGEYSSPGRAYLSKEAWEEKKSVNAAWEQFRHDMNYQYVRRPAGVTLAQIEEVRRILGLKDKEQQ